MLRHLRLHGCYLKREGDSHWLWMNPANGNMQAVPRRNEVAEMLAKGLWKRLGLPDAQKR